MFVWLRNYTLPFILAVVLHALLGLALFAGWDAEPTPAILVKPKIIKTELIQLKPSAKKKVAAPKPQKVAPKIVKQVVEKKPVPKVPQEQPDSERLAELEAKRLAEQARSERLNKLVSSSFDVALNEESQELVENKSDEIAKSYIQGIYELIVANWSRPPSARNGMKATLQVDLVPTGDVAQVVVLESSGNLAFDRSAEAAVRKAGRFEVPIESRIFEENFRSFPVIFKPEDLLR